MDIRLISWRAALSVPAAAFFSLALMGCEGDAKKPDPKKPAAEQPKDEHPKSEHPKSEHPKGEHPK